MGAAKVLHYGISDEIDDDRPIIECDHEDCVTKWFNFECVYLETVPNELWYCNQCSQFLVLEVLIVFRALALEFLLK